MSRTAEIKDGKISYRHRKEVEEKDRVILEYFIILFKKSEDEGRSKVIPRTQNEKIISHTLGRGSHIGFLHPSYFQILFNPSSEAQAEQNLWRY